MSVVLGQCHGPRARRNLSTRSRQTDSLPGERGDVQIGLAGYADAAVSEPAAHRFGVERFKSDRPGGMRNDSNLSAERIKSV